MYLAKFYLSTRPIAFLHAKAEILLKFTSNKFKAAWSTLIPRQQTSYVK